MVKVYFAVGGGELQRAITFEKATTYQVTGFGLSVFEGTNEIAFVPKDNYVLVEKD